MPDAPSPFVLHAAVPIQQDVLHVDALPLHIILAVPYPTETLSLHQGFGQEVYDDDSAPVSSVWPESLVQACVASQLSLQRVQKVQP